MSKEIDQLDSVLIHSSLSEIAEKLSDITTKDWWWDFGAPVIPAAIVAIIASGLTFWYTSLLHRRTERTQEERYNRELIDQKRMYFEEQAAQDKRHKENQLILRENLNREALNELILTVNTCYTTLATVRENYSKLLTSDLNERMFQVPIISGTTLEFVDMRVLTKLFFLVPSLGEDGKKWSQITEIEMILSNYNTLARLWGDRNMLRERVQEELLAKQVPHRFPVTHLHEFLTPETKQNLMTLTERVVSLSRELYVDLGDFLAEFKHAYEPKLNRTLPKDLLTKVIQFEDWNLKTRSQLFANEVLPDLEVLRDSFDGDDELYEHHMKLFRSRHDK